MSVVKKRVRKGLIYKRCDFGGYGKTLQDNIDQVFKLKGNYAERREELGGDKEDIIRRVVTKIRRQNSMTFGQLLLYQVGKDVTFVIEDESAEDAELESLNPSANEEGKRREVLESALHFGMLGNHVVVLQTQALKARELEKHFNWLLRECTNILPEQYSVCLSDKPTESARRKIERMPVKLARVGTPLIAEQARDEQKSTVETKSVRTNWGLEVLKNCLGDKWATMKLDDALDEDNLEVMLQVRYKKKTSKNGEKLLADIGRAFRHLEPEDAVVETVGGPTIMGKDLKLTGHINIDSWNGVLDYEDVYKSRLFMGFKEVK